MIPPVHAPCPVGNGVQEIADTARSSDEVSPVATRAAAGDEQPLPTQCGAAERVRQLWDAGSRSPLRRCEGRLELDGAQHFADPVAYRRDPRTDQLLQENGYLILRFLAEDVRKHLDAVLDAILRGVMSRSRGGALAPVTVVRRA
jgi:uncharacterized protein DUF559